jgi:hypothetical protein
MRRKVVKQGDGAPKRSRAAGATSAWDRLPLVGKTLLPISALTLSVVLMVAVFFTSTEITKDRVTQAVEGRAIAITLKALSRRPLPTRPPSEYCWAPSAPHTQMWQLCAC